MNFNCINNIYYWNICNNLFKKAIISKFGMIDDDHYLDPRSGNSFAFDHFHQVNFKYNFFKNIDI